MDERDKIENFFHRGGGKAIKVLYAASKRLRETAWDNGKEFLSPPIDMLAFSGYLRKLAANPAKVERVFWENLETGGTSFLSTDGIKGQIRFFREFDRKLNMICVLLSKLDLRVFNEQKKTQLTPLGFFIEFNRSIIDVLAQGVVAIDPNTRIGYEYYMVHQRYYELMARNCLQGMKFYDLYEDVVRLVFREDDLFRQRCLLVKEAYSKIFSEMEIEEVKQEALAVTTTEAISAAV
jgi:hypothetical protein